LVETSWYKEVKYTEASPSVRVPWTRYEQLSLATAAGIIADINAVNYATANAA
jgi:hypothetical protein